MRPKGWVWRARNGCRRLIYDCFYYSQSHLGWHFRVLFQSSKLKTRTALFTETWQKRRSSFELWAFENDTPSGIGCTCIRNLVPLLEGLCDWNPYRFEFSLFWVFTEGCWGATERVGKEPEGRRGRKTGGEVRSGKNAIIKAGRREWRMQVRAPEGVCVALFYWPEGEED